FRPAIGRFDELLPNLLLEHHRVTREARVPQQQRCLHLEHDDYLAEVQQRIDLAAGVRDIDAQHLRHRWVVVAEEVKDIQLEETTPELAQSLPLPSLQALEDLPVKTGRDHLADELTVQHEELVIGYRRDRILAKTGGRGYEEIRPNKPAKFFARERRRLELRVQLIHRSCCAWQTA